MPDFICKLETRAVIKVSGDDAESFLQNLVTNDVVKNDFCYACLLTPQGRFLHDFFIRKAGGIFFLECEAARKDDLIKRLSLYKLRAKVAIEDCSDEFAVYVSSSRQESCYTDPRLPELGYRFYRPKNESIDNLNDEAQYRDHRIALGVPEGSDGIKSEIDVMTDVNLDILNAISWDKGCYVGQEVTARMNYRALVKKRMMIVTKPELFNKDDLRVVNSQNTQGLAIIKIADKNAVEGVVTPLWLANKIT